MDRGSYPYAIYELFVIFVLWYRLRKDIEVLSQFSDLVCVVFDTRIRRKTETPMNKNTSPCVFLAQEQPF